LRPTSGQASRAESLAESWAIAKDMTSAEFTLAQRPKFPQTGTRSTAEDVKFSFERYPRRARPRC